MAANAAIIPKATTEIIVRNSTITSDNPLTVRSTLMCNVSQHLRCESIYTGFIASLILGVTPHGVRLPLYPR
jgi:hypothetical protein